MSHVHDYLAEAAEVAQCLDDQVIERMAVELDALRARGGRLWIAGLGGSSANASHAASDFRRLCRIDAVCLTDSIAFCSACANDEGWENFLQYDEREGDALLVLSVGGGTKEVSLPLVRAMERAKGKVFAIVGREGGEARSRASVCVIIPTVNEKHVTPHTEAFQMVVLHCLVSHPLLQKRATKW